jgi:centromere/kinetochore protein ZW10
MQFLNEDTNGLKDIAESNNFDLIKKALGKCKAQMNSISSIWVDVLPEYLYKKIMGQLLELVCNDLLKSCIKLEDIASDDASYLHEAFSIVETYVFEFYSRQNGSQSEIKENESGLGELNASKYIKSWHRFKYMLKLLKANLQEIVDLWSEGKGPLALHYEADEIRHLIKALFMITERRSAALAKIY